MKQEEIIENNKLIAQFMGITNVEEFNNSLLVSHPEEGIWYYEPLWYLDYHSDWSLLMPVVEKIEELNVTESFFIIEDKTCILWLTDTKDICQRSLSKIESVYNTVVEFIKWYNTQNNG